MCVCHAYQTPPGYIFFKLERTRKTRREKEEELRCVGWDMGLAGFKVTAGPIGVVVPR